MVVDVGGFGECGCGGGFDFLYKGVDFDLFESDKKCERKSFFLIFLEK